MIRATCRLFSMLLLFGFAANDPINDNKRPYFRKDYTYLEDFGAFYKFHASRRIFSEAVSTCQVEGATMFWPQSRNESDAAIKSIIRPAGDQIWGIWLGIHDLYSEGEFVTLNGSAIESVYSNWGPGQPDDNPNDADCAVMYTRDATFNDGECNFTEHFICKREAEGLTFNEMCQTTDLAYKYNVLLDKCYKVHVQPNTWQGAFKTCKAEEAALVVVNSQAEAKFLIGEMAKHPEADSPGAYDKGIFHVGFNDLINHGVYVTIEGKLLQQSGYQKWAAGQPDNQGGKEHCGSMFRAGLYNDIDCDTKAMFICEKVSEENINIVDVKFKPSDNDTMMTTLLYMMTFQESRSNETDDEQNYLHTAGSTVALPDAS